MPQPTCSVEECCKSVSARGLCSRHYYQWRKTTCPPCRVDGCEKPGTSVGMCQMHYARQQKHGDPLIVKHRHDGHVDPGCSAEDCDRKHFARGLCKRHYNLQPDRLAKAQATDRKRRSQPENRERDKARQERRRRQNGVQPRGLTLEQRTARRRAAKHTRALRKLERAASQHKATRTWIAGPCAAPRCGNHFIRSPGCQVCSKRCRKRLDNKLRRAAYGNHRERARYFGVAYEPVKRTEIFNRDGYRCQLCKRKTRGPHWLAPGRANPLAPTLDHIIPMASGGPHIFSNLQCACFECNCRKGDRAANDQLLLAVKG